MDPHSQSLGIHRGAYIQDADPGAVGVGVLWIAATAPRTVKKRNATNAGWDTLGTLAVLGTAATLDSDTDGTLGANSDSKLATQKAVKAYVDTEVAGAGAGATDLDGLSDVVITSPAVPQGIGYDGSTWKNMGSLPKKLFDSTLGTAASTIDTGAAGIAAGYDILEVFLLLRTDEAVGASTCLLSLNNDTGSNYDRQHVRGANATASAAATTGETGGWGLSISGTSEAAGVFTVVRVTIPFYAQTTAQKTAECVYGRADTTNTNNIANAIIMQWRNTAAITRMAITAPATKNLIAGSRMLIFGR